ncbi:YfiR family protein [uncultured Psychromonas sp.]|uniref:YfiR family protein n=1 Tax=uncultured Psychromonas sp. TaxID=173974 RepID=UPI0026110728|nr:YfiR family protein [uncultured Psychromonas sp.]
MLRLTKQFALTLLTLMLMLSTSAFATTREDAIKSGFIYNFARYSQGEWFHETTAKSYNLCSFNSDFVEAAKLTLKDLSVRQVPVEVRFLRSDIEDIKGCHTLFISKNDIAKWNDIIIKELIPNTMLVGEFNNFILSGGHINFFIVGGKVRFEINPNKLKQAGINMSSKVLRLGRIYKGPL